MTDQALTTGRVQQMLRDGAAQPLLEGHFPVPVQIHGEWWHVPANSGAADEGDEFVPATAALAREFDLLARRVRAARSNRRPGGPAPS